MMKFGDLRINPDQLKKYFPVNSQDKSFEIYGHDTKFRIIFIYKDGEKETLNYDTKEERDKMLESIDDVLLILKDGERVTPHMDTVVIGPDIGSLGGSGDVTMQ